MASTNLKRIGITAAFAALLVPVVVLYNQNAAQRGELAALRAANHALSESPATNNAVSEAKADPDELPRLRREHLELLNLRGRVAALSKELRERPAPAARTNVAPTTALRTNDLDSVLLTASLTNRIAAGHALIVGGWSGNGTRRYLLITAGINPDEPGQAKRTVTIKSRMLMAPEAFWEQIGWGPYRSDTHRSTLAGDLTAQQADLLVKAVKETADGAVAWSPGATGWDGQSMGVGYFASEDDDAASGIMMNVDVVPRIAPDGESVDLELATGIVPPGTPLHQSLR